MKKKLIGIISILFAAVLLCTSFNPVKAQAASYPSVFFYADENFEDLVVVDYVNVGDIYTIRMQWWPEYNHEGYVVNVLDPNGRVVASAQKEFTNTSTSARYFNITWDTAGYAAGEYTVSVTKRFYSMLDWHEAPTKSTLWLKLQQLIGWNEVDGSWYYYKDNKAVTGWQQIGGTWYFFNNSGVMQTGLQTIGGAKYYLDPVNGDMKTGWINVDGNWYYAGSSGALATDWVKVGNTWYYMNSEGIMQTGWVTIGSTKYYLDPSGAMATGWVKDGADWYYMSASGAMTTGWVKVGNTWYYMKSTGEMAANEWVIGYYWISASGAWTYQPVGSWKKNDTGWWFGDTSGWYAKNETLKINDEFYTFNAAGYWEE